MKLFLKFCLNFHFRLFIDKRELRKIEDGPTTNFFKNYSSIELCAIIRTNKYRLVFNTVRPRFC